MDRLRVRRSTVFGLVKDGKLRSVKIGARRLIPEQALVDFIAALDEQAAAERADQPIADQPSGAQPRRTLPRNALDEAP